MTQRLANWMPEDDDMSLRHIPLQYGVPYDDFNWPWYWAQKKKAEEQRLKMKEEGAQTWVVIVNVIVLLVVWFIISGRT